MYLKRQAKISSDAQSSADVQRLASAYAKRVHFAADHGVRQDEVSDIATEHRSALKYAEAAKAIEEHSGFESDDDLLALHADSLFNDYKRSRINDEKVLRKAIGEFETVIERTGTARIGDIITLIEAQRDLSDRLGVDDATFSTLAEAVQDLAAKAQATLDANANLREWSLLGFYGAEAVHARAEQALCAAAEASSSTTAKDRRGWLEDARRRYVQVLPGLSRYRRHEGAGMQRGPRGRADRALRIRAGRRQRRELFARGANSVSRGRRVREGQHAGPRVRRLACEPRRRYPINAVKVPPRGARVVPRRAGADRARIGYL